MVALDMIKERTFMKTCKTCKQNLPLAKFSKSKKTRSDGTINEYYDSTCMVCRRKQYLSKEGKRDMHRASSKEWYLANPEKAKSQRLKRYGIDFDGYNKLRETQNYRCAICNKHESEVSQGRAKTPATALHVDHCHSTNKIRGLLCTNCNTILGKCYDNEDILMRAVSYLQGKL
jgi:hypothetical protein